jgi:hypothetical protein
MKTGSNSIIGIPSNALLQTESTEQDDDNDIEKDDRHNFEFKLKTPSFTMKLNDIPQSLSNHSLHSSARSPHALNTSGRSSSRSSHSRTLTALFKTVSGEEGSYEESYDDISPSLHMHDYTHTTDGKSLYCYYLLLQLLLL